MESVSLWMWSCVITGTILAKADGLESYLQLLFCATECLSGIEIRQRCRLRHHFCTSFSSGRLWSQQSSMTRWTVVSLHVMIFCTIPLLQHEPTKKWNAELVCLLPLCKEEFVEDCPCPPSKYSQGSLTVFSNHINYIGTPKLEDKKFSLFPLGMQNFFSISVYITNCISSCPLNKHLHLFHVT